MILSSFFPLAFLALTSTAKPVHRIDQPQITLPIAKRFSLTRPGHILAADRARTAALLNQIREPIQPDNSRRHLVQYFMSVLQSYNPSDDHQW